MIDFNDPSNKLHSEYHAEDGRPLSVKERQFRRQMARNEEAANAGLAKATVKQVDNPSGGLTFEQRQKARRDADNRVAMLRLNTPKPQPESPFADRIAELEQRLKWVQPDERSQIRRTIDALQQAENKRLADVEAKAKRELFDSHEAIQIAKRHAESFNKQPPDESERQNAASLTEWLQSTHEGDPDLIVEKYWAEVSAMESRAASRLESAIEQRKQSHDASSAELANLQSQLDQLKNNNE
jgi:hypothetical protein